MAKKIKGVVISICVNCEKPYLKSDRKKNPQRSTIIRGNNTKTCCPKCSSEYYYYRKKKGYPLKNEKA